MLDNQRIENMHNFKRLDIWNKSIALVKEVYILTKNFPNSEKFGLASQMQRAVVSIPANIAEGSAKSSDKDFSRFLEISLGSTCELETLVIIAKELDYICSATFDELDAMIQEVMRMLKGFQNTLSSNV
jgi:four helix bundle protein